MNAGQITEIINRVAKASDAYRREEVMFAYFLENFDGDDYGAEFCEACARKVVARERRENSEVWGPVMIAEAEEYDGAVRCHECNADLLCSLTEDGANQELEDFERNGFDIASGKHCHHWMQCEVAYAKESPEFARLLAVAEKSIIAASGGEGSEP